MTRDPNKYETSDLYLAAFLMAEGTPKDPKAVMELEDVVKNGDRGMFVFVEIPERFQLVKDFLNRKAGVKASSYRDCIRDLKGQVSNL